MLKFYEFLFVKNQIFLKIEILNLIYWSEICVNKTNNWLTVSAIYLLPVSQTI